METIQEHIRRLTESACVRHSITREELAERIGMQRETLYNASKRPRYIKLHRVERLENQAGLSDTDRLAVEVAWVEDRARSNALLRACLETLEYEARDRLRAMRRLLERFRELKPDG